MAKLPHDFTLHVRLPAALAAHAATKARDEGVSLSALIRRAVTREIGERA